MDQYSIVSTATCYRLDGPGNAFWWPRDFLHFSRPAPYTLGMGDPAELYLRSHFCLQRIL